ncbi:MAG: rod shape-determining protein MreC [Deltaproteobacteria bacterium]|nr:rod shape-determining protein MreC [Deltaproteobacteria bacterium]
MATFYKRRFVPILFGLFLALSLYFLYARGKPEDERNIIDRAVIAVISPVQSLVGRIGDGLSGLWTDYIYLYDQKQELDRLREENEKLRARVLELTPLAAARDEAERSLQFQKVSEPRKLVPARVVARTITPFFQVTRIRVDVGGAELRDGMPVISPDGVVGTVRQVFGDYADVLLLVDRERKVAVVLERTRAFGTLEGLGKDQPYLTRMQFLAREDRLVEGDLVLTAGESIAREGDIVTTSGLDRVFPPGLVIGRVTRVSEQNLKQRQEAFVQPAVDFNRLRRVFVDVSAGLTVPVPATPRPK